MEMILNNLHKVAAGAGIWYTVNGILHSVFVIAQHKTGYDRTLLRLLLDGHILMLSGLMLLLIYPGIRDGHPYAYNLVLLSTIGMIIYCALIFPFLKSVMTILISLIVLTLVIIKLVHQ